MVRAAASVNQVQHTSPEFPLESQLRLPLSALCVIDGLSLVWSLLSMFRRGAWES